MTFFAASAFAIACYVFCISFFWAGFAAALGIAGTVLAIPVIFFGILWVAEWVVTFFLPKKGA